MVGPLVICGAFALLVASIFRCAFAANQRPGNAKCYPFQPV